MPTAKPVLLNLEATILEKHSKAQKDLIVDYVGNDARRFAKLMGLFLKGEYRVTQRASWPLSYCIQQNPQLIKPWFGKLLNKMKEPGVHDAVARNILRMFQYVSIPSSYQGQVMTLCFNYLEDVRTPVAIKAFALSALQQLAVSYPEIGPELKLIIEERWPHESAAFRSRAKKLLVALEKG